MRYHPDRNKSKNAHEKFVQVTEAYHFLIDHKQGNIKGKWESTTKTQETQETQEDRKRKEAKTKAAEYAKMKYEEFLRENEALRYSYSYWFFHIINFAVALVFLSFGVALIIAPLIVLFSSNGIEMPIILLPISIVGFFLIRFMLRDRRNFNLGLKGYFAEIFTEKKDRTAKCFYTSDEKADGKYIRYLLFLRKQVAYEQKGEIQYKIIIDRKVVKIPRSVKATKIHTISSGIKIFSIVIVPFFLTSHFSIAWKIMLGVLFGSLVSGMFLANKKTKPKYYHLYNLPNFLRIALFMTVFISSSRVDSEQMVVSTSPYLPGLVLLTWIFLEMILIPIITLFTKTENQLQFSKHYPAVNNYLKQRVQIWICTHH